MCNHNEQMLSLVIDIIITQLLNKQFLWFIKHNFLFHSYQLFFIHLNYLIILKLMIYVLLNKYNSLWQIEKEIYRYYYLQSIVALNLNYKNKKFHWIFISNKKKKKREHKVAVIIIIILYPSILGHKSLTRRKEERRKKKKGGNPQESFTPIISPDEQFVARHRRDLE